MHGLAEGNIGTGSYGQRCMMGSGKSMLIDAGWEWEALERALAILCASHSQLHSCSLAPSAPATQTGSLVEKSLHGGTSIFCIQYDLRVPVSRWTTYYVLRTTY